MLLIIEGIVREEYADPCVCSLDVLMLAVSGGRERTVGGISDLLHGAGFRANRVVETASTMRIVEAAAV